MSYKTILLQQTNAFFHVFNRGADKQKIFYSRDNYLYFLEKMQKYTKQFDICILAYCLMPNHFHFLLMQKIAKSISQFMKLTTNSYSKALNKRLNRSGHLYEGDYRIKIVDTDEYLIHLSGYIHANPVEANLVKKPEDWEFSSYREYIGRRNGTLPQKRYVFDSFGNIDQYKEFVESFGGKDLEKIKKYIYK